MTIQKYFSSWVPVLLVLAMPSIAFAVTFEELVVKFRTWMNLIIPIIFGIALIYFFWGLATFINNSGDEKGREEGKSKMIWGILALFVMVAIWGILRFISTTLDIDEGGTFDPPSFGPPTRS